MFERGVLRIFVEGAGIVLNSFKTSLRIQEHCNVNKFEGVSFSPIIKSEKVSNKFGRSLKCLDAHTKLFSRKY